MIYVVSRASQFGSEKNAPCKEAIKRSLKYQCTHTCSEEEFNRLFSQRQGLWRSKGNNHTLTNKGHITREEERVEWSIEINTLEELLAFIERYGSIIISSPPPTHGLKHSHITIYDDYME